MSTPSDKGRILAVDDTSSTLELLQRNLTSQGYQVFTAPNVADAIRLLESTPIDLVITDLKMPGASGMDLIRHVRENFKDMEVMMITGYPTIEGAVTAVKSGAEDFLAKPFTDEELAAAVQRACEKLQRRRMAQATLFHTPHSPQGLIGESEAMQKLRHAIAKAATTSATVLITGESGTGKELVARAIHYSSARAAAAFVPVNCGAIPETLQESELFGYLKGAFTGATETRNGFFQTAEAGSIFLDEISETSSSMQVKLLRVLQDKEVRKVGATTSQKVDVRILAATNKDLTALVKKEAFREDLFYRLNVITIAVPPLRERENDVLLLANYFVTKFAAESGKKTARFSDEVWQALKNYYWPGNIRELENLLQRLLVMADDEMIEVVDLPAHMHFSAGSSKNLQRTLAEVEIEHIRNVLASVDGNKTRAAEILGIDRKTLREKLKPHTIKAP
ncbi:MAG: Regulatory protein AtoC [bacterium]|nr:Regulatory protein AtoC [bacterium]